MCYLNHGMRCLQYTPPARLFGGVLHPFQRCYLSGFPGRTTPQMWFSIQDKADSGWQFFLIVLRASSTAIMQCSQPFAWTFKWTFIKSDAWLTEAMCINGSAIPWVCDWIYQSDENRSDKTNHKSSTIGNTNKWGSCIRRYIVFVCALLLDIRFVRSARM